MKKTILFAIFLASGWVIAQSLGSTGLPGVSSSSGLAVSTGALSSVTASSGAKSSNQTSSSGINLSSFNLSSFLSSAKLSSSFNLSSFLSSVATMSSSSGGSSSGLGSSGTQLSSSGTSQIQNAVPIGLVFTHFGFNWNSSEVFAVKMYNSRGQLIAQNTSVAHSFVWPSDLRAGVYTFDIQTHSSHSVFQTQIGQ